MNDADSKEILKTRLMNGEISIKEYKEIMKILDEEEVKAKTVEPHVQQKKAADNVISLLPNAFEFTGARKILFYLVLVLSALGIALLVADLCVILLFDMEPIFLLMDPEIDGTLVNYILGDPPYRDLAKFFLGGIHFAYVVVSPLLVVLFYFARRSYIKNQNVAGYDVVIECARPIVLVEVICGLLYLSRDMISNLLLLSEVALFCFVFFPVFRLQKLKVADKK